MSSTATGGETEYVYASRGIVRSRSVAVWTTERGGPATMTMRTPKIKKKTEARVRKRRKKIQRREKAEDGVGDFVLISD
jgi:hypothetical protein